MLEQLDVVAPVALADQVGVASLGLRKIPVIAVHVALDAVHPPLAGVLPRPDLASVVEFGAVFSQPERIGGQAICLELGGNKVGGAVQADLAASPFDRLQKL